LPAFAGSAAAVAGVGGAVVPAADLVERVAEDGSEDGDPVAGAAR
jgi:hypothetical protein